jgi:hypothetical protein
LQKKVKKEKEKSANPSHLWILRNTHHDYNMGHLCSMISHSYLDDNKI